MNLKDRVCIDIKQSITYYQEKGFIRNLNIIDCTETNTITYKRKGKGIYKLKERYVQEFLNIQENKDYICRLDDGSVIQGYYIFNENNEELVEASIKYFPNPGLEIGDISEIILDPNINNQLEFANIAMYEENFKTSSNYIRIDYKPEDKNDIIHPSTHMHIGANNELRLSVNRVPFFSHFLEFILFTYYKDKWVKYMFNLKDEIKLKDLEEKKFLESNNINIKEFLLGREKEIEEKSINSGLSENEEKYYMIKL